MPLEFFEAGIGLEGYSGQCLGPVKAYQFTYLQLPILVFTRLVWGHTWIRSVIWCGWIP